MNQRGITLVELMVALMLLAIALLGLAASFPLAMYGVTGGGLQTVATNLAMEVIEQAKRTAYGNLSTLDTGGSAVAVAGYPGFTRQVTVAAYSGTPGTACNACTSVTATVFFTGQNEETVQTTVATVFAAP